MEKRVEQARQAVIEAREALDKFVAIQQEQEALLADRKSVDGTPGERRECTVQCPWCQRPIKSCVARTNKITPH